MAELPLVLYCFLLIIVFPLIDMLGVASGATIIYLSTNEAATRAANQRRYSDSLNGMYQTTTAFTQTGFSNFAKMQSIGGYESSGSDLYIDANNTKTDTVQSYGPNTALTGAVDQSTYVYEARVNSAFQVGPLINLNFLPFLGSVDGLGKPAIINFSASKQIEYPNGLAQAAAVNNNPVTAFNTTPSPNEATSGGGTYQSGWNMPDIYNAIAAAGQTVVNTTVIQVWANNPNLTSTTISLASTQNLWIDLRANGTWASGGGVNNIQTMTGATVSDANGIPPASWPSFWAGPGNGTNAPVNTDNPQVLLGKIGTNPYFIVGDSLQSYAAGQTGVLGLVMNDNFYNYDPATGVHSTVWGSGYADNYGVQTVRVIVTQ